MVAITIMQNTYTALYAHIIFATKNRERTIRAVMRVRLHAYLAGISRNLGSTSIAVGGVDDHVHLLIRYPSRSSVADLVMKLKSNSSRWIHETFPQMRRFEWQDGYAALAVSQSRVADVRRYVENQEQHHARRRFVDEWGDIVREIEGPSESVGADAARAREK